MAAGRRWLDKRAQCTLWGGRYFSGLMASSVMRCEFRQCVRALNLPTFLFAFNDMAAMCATPVYAKTPPALQSKGAGSD
jgi:hypothetical protein